jgi:hypothetical protein
MEQTENICFPKKLSCKNSRGLFFPIAVRMVLYVFLSLDLELFFQILLNKKIIFFRTIISMKSCSLEICGLKERKKPIQQNKVTVVESLWFCIFRSLFNCY